MDVANIAGIGGHGRSLGQPNGVARQGARRRFQGVPQGATHAQKEQEDAERSDVANALPLALPRPRRSARRQGGEHRDHGGRHALAHQPARVHREGAASEAAHDAHRRRAAQADQRAPLEGIARGDDGNPRQTFTDSLPEASFK